MKERPILFSGPMVRAILEGRKTQTRRVLKYPPSVAARGIDPRMDEWMPRRYTRGSGQYPGGNPDYTGDQPPGLLVTCIDWTCQRVPCPYGHSGDRLWVRETWAYAGPGSGSDLPAYVAEGRDEQNKTPANCWFKATFGSDADEYRWNPSIHMPRWASRILLEITEVRVQRLQEISQEDARAEGVEGLYAGDGNSATDWRGDFQRLWDCIHTKNGWLFWDSNPWVWAITFRRVEQ